MLFLDFFQEGITHWRNEEYSEARVFFFLSFIALLLLIVSPIFTIISLNHLFLLNIPLNFKSCCAVYWIMFLARTAMPVSSSNSNRRNENRFLGQNDNLIDL